ncbi:MAG: tRNA pseudouridine(55) synthase TruB [Alphaproteobacteria bacterium]|nr:MAG: tRNA pseudouridine(55) synthase TruB [Alphaproteobacteria bacterium]
MGRRKKGRAIHGWLVLDKPVGMTSTQAVGAVRRLFDARKAGHAGTLDPLATGVLPIALGEATKTVPYAVDGTKHYRFTVRWGAGTDTDDAEGRITATSELRPAREAVEALLPRFTGSILQTPPAFSAIKVDGNRAYDLARAGEVVELEARLVQIDSLDLRDMPDADTAIFEARCGKGTYVRALARDMGSELECLGHLIALRRTRVAPFDEAQAVRLSDLEAAAEEGEDALHALLLPIEAALQDLAAISVGQNDAARLLRGQAVLIRGRDAPTTAGPTYATCKGQLIAVGQIEKGELRPVRVFNFDNAG